MIKQLQLFFRKSRRFVAELMSKQPIAGEIYGDVEDFMKSVSAPLLFLCLILQTPGVYAQGRVYGLVRDSLTMDQLAGAEINLEGTTFSAVSNTDGEFRMAGIPSGEYMLRASFLGYQGKKYLVNITSGDMLKIRVELVPEMTREHGVPFTQQAKNQAEEINRQIRSNTVTNVIGSKKLEGLPDESIPVALSRLPGVSIIYAPPLSINFSSGAYGVSSDQSIQISFPPQNDFSLPENPVSRVFIRGLDSKYGNITIDGIRISPTSPKDKSVDLGILSERNFQNIEVRKTITSEEDGDATAGALNLVPGKAPDKRLIRAEFTGNANRLDKSANQYDFTGSYGERFFDDVLGIRADAHTGKKIVSREYRDVFGGYYSFKGFSYANSVAERNGGSVVLDFITPDGGSIRIDNILSKMNTISFESEADSGGIYPVHIFDDKESKQEIFVSSIQGTQYLFGFEVDWSAAFSESRDSHPSDYSLNFYGSTPVPPGIPIPVYPDYLAYTVDSPSKNYCREKTASLGVRKKYTISNEITGEVKFGGKYTVNARSYDENSLAQAVPKHQDLLSSFEDHPPRNRNLFDEYEIPLMNKDALLSFRQMYAGNTYSNGKPDINSYDLSGNVSAGYLVHYLKFGHSATFIAGVRIEGEHNDCSGYYYPNIMIDPGYLYNDVPKQTSTFRYTATAMLPNFQMVLCPSDFLTLRLAAYRTTIRPDCIARMPKYFSAVLYDGNGTVAGADLVVGNPDLKNSDVWNYEYQTQFYGYDLGLFSINAFYKNIEGMVQATNGMQLGGAGTIEQLGIHWRNYVPLFPLRSADQYNLFSYFNSPKPTRIWGFEFEHQANFRYLPGFLKNLVLNYNFTFLRSEAWTKDVVVTVTTTTSYALADKKQKLADMPEFLANVNLGYDIKGFSFRVSYFYQSEYPMYDDYFGEYDPMQIQKSKMSRLDIAVQQRILKNASIILNLNNVTNFKEEALYKYHSSTHWRTAQAYRYGMNFDFGIGIEL
jgi:outer membrane receptor protein involved in Fe transport